MKKAFYMRFSPGTAGAADRVGGLPFHLPQRFPTTPNGQPLTFLAQFYCTAERLTLGDTLCVQLYQQYPVVEALPTVVLVPFGATENTQSLGVRNPSVVPHLVEWREALDPEEPPEEFTEETTSLRQSKAGGLFCFDPNCIEPGEEFLLQLRDDRKGKVTGLNFGGYSLILVATSSGGVEARLA